MALRTTTPVQRVDMLLVQAERFAELKVAEEAIARARQVIAYAELEGKRNGDPQIVADLEMRAMIARSLIRRLDGKARSVDAEDAAVPDSWT